MYTIAYTGSLPSEMFADINVCEFVIASFNWIY